MNIDHTTLLKVLKHEDQQPKEPTDAEKIEAANELHDWLHNTGKGETK